MSFYCCFSMVSGTACHDRRRSTSNPKRPNKKRDWHIHWPVLLLEFLLEKVQVRIWTRIHLKKKLYFLSTRCFFLFHESLHSNCVSVAQCDKRANIVKISPFFHVCCFNDSECGEQSTHSKVSYCAAFISRGSDSIYNTNKRNGQAPAHRRQLTVTRRLA